MSRTPLGLLVHVEVLGPIHSRGSHTMGSAPGVEDGRPALSPLPLVRPLRGRR